MTRPLDPSQEQEGDSQRHNQESVPADKDQEQGEVDQGPAEGWPAPGDHQHQGHRVRKTGQPQDKGPTTPTTPVNVKIRRWEDIFQRQRQSKDKGPDLTKDQTFKKKGPGRPRKDSLTDQSKMKLKQTSLHSYLKGKDLEDKGWSGGSRGLSGQGDKVKDRTSSPKVFHPSRGREGPLNGEGSQGQGPEKEYRDQGPGGQGKKPQ